MNVIKKPNKNLLKIIIDESDLNLPNEKVKPGLLDVLSVVEGLSVLISIKTKKNLSTLSLAILLRFAASLRRKNIELSLETNQNTIDQLLELGIGRLIQSLQAA